MASTYDIKKHKKGDTWNGGTFTLEVNAAPADLTDAAITSTFRDPNGDPRATFSVDDGITITDAAAGEFKFDKQVINWPAATYIYDIQITFANGDVKTYIAGTWPICQDATY